MKMKPAAVKLGMYIECGFENNYNNPKFNVNDRVRIPKSEIKIHKELHFKSAWGVFCNKGKQKYCALEIVTSNLDD